MTSVRSLLGASLLACLIATQAFAQPADPPAPSAAGARTGDQAAPRNRRDNPPLPALPADSRTTHTATIGGKALTYSATAGAITLRDDKGEAQGQIFYVAYTLTPGGDGKPAAGPNKRPLTFAVNGGPGAASVYLDLAAIGPRLLPFGDGARFASDNGDLVDNPDSWLAFTDLVFIDPIGTGYSRTTHGTEEENKRFWGVRQDIDSLADFIALYLSQSDRYASPKYLAGESYGGFRVPRLLSRLMDRHGIGFAGAVMISPVLDYAFMGGNDIDPMPWAIRLPSMAAAELEKKGQLAQPAGQDALAEAERFATHDYLAGLAEGPRAPGAQAFYARIATLIGLPAADVAKAEGKIGIGQFVKEHSAAGEVGSLYDADVAGPDPYPQSPYPRGGDPILIGSKAPLATAFQRYAHEDLGYKTDRTYVVLSDDVERKWEYGITRQGYVEAVTALRTALALSPGMKLLIAHGYTDLVTPYFASRYIASHIPLPPNDGKGAPALQLKLYPGGHMMYLRPASRTALAHDAAALYPASP